MNETEYIPDWWVDEHDARKAVHNITNIRKATEERLERMSY